MIRNAKLLEKFEREQIRERSSDYFQNLRIFEGLYEEAKHLRIPAEQAGAVRDIAHSAGLMPLVDPEAFTLKTLVLPCYDPKTGIRVDFTFSFTPYGMQAMKRVVYVDIGQAKVRFVSLEDLIIHKLVSRRPRDAEDVRSVTLKNKGMDVKYIRKWLKEFAALLKLPLLAKFNALLKERK